MTTKEMLDRTKEAFRQGQADVKRRVLLVEGIRPYAKNNDLAMAYRQGYAKAVKEISEEARREKTKRSRYEFKGEKA